MARPKKYPDILQYQLEYRSREDVKEHRAKYLKEYAELNKEKLAKYKSQYYYANKERHAEKRKKYRERDKKAPTSRKSAYKLRRKNKLGDIGKMFKKDIKEIYSKRQEGQHVDHIIPICGENVTGLHVPWNLQIIPDVDNMSKSNYVDLKHESEIQLSLSLKDSTRRES